MATVYKSYWSVTESGSGKNGAAVAASPVSAASLVGQTVKLSEGESRHLVKVFRARQGDTVMLFDAAGNVWRGALADTAGRVAQVRIEAHETIAAPCPQITLGQALPKGKTMDSVIAAMVELGVAAIVPLATDHSEVRIERDAARSEAKREHWQQTAIEAAKQSSNFHGTQIAPIHLLKAFLEGLPSQAEQGSGSAAASNGTAPSAQLRIIGSLEDGSVPLASLAPQIASAQSVVCLIGPEGDFSPAEYALARQYGFRPVRLGSHVLRVKTAATYIVSTVDALARAAADR